MSESKQPDQVRGKQTNEDGEVVAEDGKPVTDELEEIYEFDEELKKENTKNSRRGKSKREQDRNKNEVEVVDEETRNELQEAQDAVITDVFQVPKQCNYCYLQDKCQYYEKGADCYFKTEVNVNSAKNLLDLMKMAIEMQGERVIFGRLIEETEGGYTDQNLSNEITRLTEMIQKFKDLVTDSEEISIKFKGSKSVQQSQGVLSELFGSNDDDKNKED